MKLVKLLCTLILAVIVFMFAALQAALGAQTVNGSGHWTGSIQAGDMSIAFQLDLERDAAGKLAGTFSGGPSQVTGLPIFSAGLNGKVLRVVLRGNTGDSVFEGTIAADGKSIAGTVTHEGASYPFTLAHGGPAKVAKPATSPAIPNSLEGTWSGAADAGGQQAQFILRMRNEADGSIGTLVHVNRSSMELPVAIAVKGEALTVDVVSVGAKFEGKIATDEIAGTLTVQGASFPLVFRRSK